MASNSRSASPEIRVYSELQRMLTPEQCDHLFPSISSAVASNSIGNEQTAQQQQQNHHTYSDDFMDVDESQYELVNTTEARQLEETNTDADFALRLQEEEYTRPSVKPSLLNTRRPNKDKFPSIFVDTNNELIVSDAEFAAHLQAEENQKQQRHRQRPAPSTQRRVSHRSSQSDEPEIIPTPPFGDFARNRSSSNGNTNQNIIDAATSLVRVFASASQQRSNSHRSNNRRNINLQNNNEDFGPNDYENLLELDNTIKQKGLTNQQINRLPTEKFHHTTSKNDEENKCSICMDQFEQNETLRRLPCLHIYHKHCIDHWLKEKDLCPICRISSNK